jgi:hypothetical protein
VSKTPFKISDLEKNVLVEFNHLIKDTKKFISSVTRGLADQAKQA